MSVDNSIDKLANTYWNDYQNGHPIAGGVAYEALLRDCHLNLSLESLKELDKLLSNIRKDLQVKFAKSNQNLTPSEQKKAMYHQESFRKLLMFIGFYTGKILAKVYKAQPKFLLQKQLSELNSAYSSSKFEHSIALVFVDENKRHHLQGTRVANIQQPWLFFVLEPITVRLFGGFDYQVQSIQNKTKVADGLYRSVLERLPEQIVSQIKKNNQEKRLKSTQTHFGESANSPLGIIENQSQKVTAVPVAEHNQEIHRTSQLLQTRQNRQNIESNIVSSITNNNDSSNSQVNPPVNSQQNNRTNYSYLIDDLQKFDVPQTKGEQAYQEGSHVMKKFDELARKQNNLTSQMSLSNQHKKLCNDAVSLIAQAAKEGNTTAILHLAVYYLRGDWLAKNKEKGISLIQMAANAKDFRAMRALSKAYYQGDGVEQNMSLGKYWLEQAAEAGHPEANHVVNQMKMTELMIDDVKLDKKTDKRYLYLIGLTVLVALLVLILL